MEKQRKEKGDKKLILKVSVMTLMVLILIVVLGVAIIIPIVSYPHSISDALNIPDIKRTLLIVSLIAVVYVLLLSYFLFKMIMNNEKAKISKRVAEEVLPIDTYIKVNPRKGHFKHYRFFQEEIVEISEYFAILAKDKDRIGIFLKIEKHDKYFFLESLEKEDFLDAYEVIETDKTTN